MHFTIKKHIEKSIQKFDNSFVCFSHAPVACSMNHSEVMKPTAIKKKTNFKHLNLFMLNSSMITSRVAMYIKVPALTDMKIPVMRSP